jgi:hypothetical protein
MYALLNASTISTRSNLDLPERLYQSGLDVIHCTDRKYNPAIWNKGPKNRKTPSTSAIHFDIVLKMATLEFFLERTLHRLINVVRTVRLEK